MVSLEKNIAGIAPGLMAVALTGKSAKLVDDSLKGKSKKGDFIKTSVDILAGVPLIGATATSASAL